jgi:hypothetical protein
MSRRVAPFRQHEVTRALRAAIAAGLKVSGYEIDPATGRIIVNTTGEPRESNPTSDLERWLVKHGQKIYSR